MTDLDRLLDGSPSPRTRALLRAGRAETSPAEFSQRLLVGVSAAAATAAVTSGAAASLATTAKLGSVVSGAAIGSVGTPSLALLAAKWVAVGVVGGGILAAGADFALAPRTGPTSTSSAANHDGARRPEPFGAGVATPPSPLPAEPAPHSAATPSGLPTTPTAASAMPAAAPVGARSGQLGREVEIIDRVRRALALGNTSLALNELDAFARIANTGVLDREARVLRIQALRAAGDAAGSRKLAEQYLLDFPNDAHALRLRARDASDQP